MDTITMTLQSVARTLAMIDTDELERHVNDCKSSARYWDGIGFVLDPTAYRDSLQSGARDDARIQLEITEHLLKARQLIDERERQVAKRSDG